MVLRDAAVDRAVAERNACGRRCGATRVICWASLPAEGAASTAVDHGQRDPRARPRPRSAASGGGRIARARRCWWSSRTSTGPTRSEVAQLADLAAAVATLPVLLDALDARGRRPHGPGWRARARGCPVTTLDLAPLADDEARDLAARYGGLPARASWKSASRRRPVIRCFSTSCSATAQSGQTTLPGLGARPAAGPDRPLAAGSAAWTARRRGSRLALLARRVAPRARGAGLRHGAGSSRPVWSAADGDECRFSHCADPRRGLRVAAALDTPRAPSSLGGLVRGDAIRGCRRITSPRPRIPRRPAAYLRAATQEQRASRLDRALAHAQRSRELARAAPDLCASLRDDRRDLPDAGPHRRCDRRVPRKRRSRRIDRASGRAAGSASRRACASSTVTTRRSSRSEHAEQAAAAETDPRLLAQLWTLRGNLHFPRGELDACLAAHGRALEYARQAGLARGHRALARRSRRRAVPARPHAHGARGVQPLRVALRGARPCGPAAELPADGGHDGSLSRQLRVRARDQRAGRSGGRAGRRPAHAAPFAVVARHGRDLSRELPAGTQLERARRRARTRDRRAPLRGGSPGPARARRSAVSAMHALAQESLAGRRRDHARGRADLLWPLGARVARARDRRSGPKPRAARRGRALARGRLRESQLSRVLSACHRGEPAIWRLGPRGALRGRARGTTRATNDCHGPISSSAPGGCSPAPVARRRSSRARARTRMRCWPKRAGCSSTRSPRSRGRDRARDDADRVRRTRRNGRLRQHRPGDPAAASPAPGTCGRRPDRARRRRGGSGGRTAARREVHLCAPEAAQLSAGSSRATCGAATCSSTCRSTCRASTC